jgi:hypothetical protein
MRFSLTTGKLLPPTLLLALAIAVSALAADDNSKGTASGKAAAPSNPFFDDAANANPLPDKNLSFVKNIAPILVAKCSRCHIDAAKGKFSMATFESLIKGSADGAVFQPGKGSGSRLVDLLQSGDMPRAGPKATQSEIAAISKWIDEGAKFDGAMFGGADEKTPLVKLVSATTTVAGKPAPPPASKNPEETKLTVVQATGRETVKFSKDIAPVLVDNCFACHSGPGPTGNFQMGRFVDMIRGGQSGNPWVPNQPAESLLIKKLKGTAGKRMPQPDKAAPLPAETIAKFEKWISEGAHFDGPDPKQSTEVLAALVRAKDDSPAELAADRLAAAKHMWILTNPTDKPTFKESKNLLIVSNLPTGELADVAKIAEQQAAIVAKQFHAPAGQPLVKGGITLLVFPGRYDYSEFGQMVEERTLPRDWRGHWKYNTIDAYAAIVPPSDPAEYSLAGILEQQLAAVYLASLPGQPPDWFAEGSGRVLASRVDAKSARVHDWNDRLAQLAAGGKIDAFIKQGLSPDDNDIAAYGFVKQLMTDAAKYSQLLAALRNGETFDAAIQRIFGSPLQVLVTAWAKPAR